MRAGRNLKCKFWLHLLNCSTWLLFWGNLHRPTAWREAQCMSLEYWKRMVRKALRCFEVCPSWSFGDIEPYGVHVRESVLPLLMLSRKRIKKTYRLQQESALLSINHNISVEISDYEIFLKFLRMLCILVNFSATSLWPLTAYLKEVMCWMCWLKNWK